MPGILSFSSKSANPQARHLKVIVHGYLSAVDERDRSRLLELLPQPAPHEDILLACWDSGNLKEMLTRSLKGAAIGFAGFNKLALARSALFAVKGGVEHFQAKKELAARVGEVLLDELQQALAGYPHAEQLSLYGHSLGGRVVIEALLGLAGPPTLPLHDLVLMGAARTLTAEELEQILPRLQGRLFNCYSRTDKVLLAKPGFGKWAGRHPLPDQLFPERVHNIKLDIGHSDYWSLLDGIFAKVASPQLDIDLQRPARPRKSLIPQRIRGLRK